MKKDNTSIRNDGFSKRLQDLVEDCKDKDHTLSTPKQCKEMEIPYQSFMKYYNGTAECGFENLIKIAKYYNVSTDYLLGLTETKLRDISAAGAAELLGLSDSAIERLSRLNEFNGSDRYTDVLSAAIEGGNLNEFLEVLIEYLGLSWEKDHYPDFLGKAIVKPQQIQYCFDIRDIISTHLQRVVDRSLDSIADNYFSKHTKSLKEVNEAYRRECERLNEALGKNEITLEQYNQAIEDLTKRGAVDG